MGVLVLASAWCRASEAWADTNDSCVADAMETACETVRKEFAESHRGQAFVHVCKYTKDCKVLSDVVAPPPVMRANAFLVVTVFAPETCNLRLSLGGQRGVSMPEMTQAALKKEESSKKCHPTTVRFAPRRPGSADLSIVLTRGGPTTEVVTEFEVEPLFYGAVRLGLGLVFRGAVERQYEARLLNGSLQHEVVATDQSAMNPEVVVGFSAYVWDMLHHGGRAYHSESRWWRLLPNPYLGVAILTQGTQGVQTLKSVYLGGDIEFFPQFSVAIAAVARRANRLAPGLQVGGPARPDQDLTVERWNWGVAVVVNVAPDFFRFAAQGGEYFAK